MQLLGQAERGSPVHWRGGAPSTGAALSALLASHAGSSHHLRGGARGVVEGVCWRTSPPSLARAPRRRVVHHADVHARPRHRHHRHGARGAPPVRAAVAPAEGRRPDAVGGTGSRGRRMPSRPVVPRSASQHRRRRRAGGSAGLRPSQPLWEGRIAAVEAGILAHGELIACALRDGAGKGWVVPRLRASVACCRAHTENANRRRGGHSRCRSCWPRGCRQLNDSVRRRAVGGHHARRGGRLWPEAALLALGRCTLVRRPPVERVESEHDRSQHGQADRSAWRDSK